jgi:hypothetical protein
LPSCAWEPLWRAPVFGTRMFILTRHWPMMDNSYISYMNKICPTTQALVRCTYIYRQMAFQKPIFCIQGDWKHVNKKKLRFFSPHHSNFSNDIHIWESKISAKISHNFLTYNWPRLCYLGNKTECCSVDKCWLLIKAYTN